MYIEFKLDKNTYYSYMIDVCLNKWLYFYVSLCVMRALRKIIRIWSEFDFILSFILLVERWLFNILSKKNYLHHYQIVVEGFRF